MYERGHMTNAIWIINWCSLGLSIWVEMANCFLKWRCLKMLTQRPWSTISSPMIHRLKWAIMFNQAFIYTTNIKTCQAFLIGAMSAKLEITYMYNTNVVINRHMRLLRNSSIQSQCGLKYSTRAIVESFVYCLIYSYFIFIKHMHACLYPFMYTEHNLQYSKTLVS